MAEQSLIVSMWEEILENYDEQDRAAFIGGGEETVERLEAKLGFTLPQEFADYIRFYCPSEDLGVAELFQGTSLVAFNNLAQRDYNESYGMDEINADYRKGYSLDELEPGGDVYLLIFAIDEEDALATNLKDPNRPVYSYSAGDGGEHLKQIAPNFAHGLYLLGYHQRLQLQGERRGLNRFSSEWNPIIGTFQTKLDALAPGVKAEQWYFYAYP